LGRARNRFSIKITRRKPINHLITTKLFFLISNKKQKETSASCQYQLNQQHLHNDIGRQRQ
jgi:hypothetical protein